MASAHDFPLPKFYFRFTMDDFNGHFSEVTGLSNEISTIEYRSSSNRAFKTMKMPGLKKTGNVTLKKGILIGSDSFWKWYSDVKMNTFIRKTAVIELLDETGAVTMKWTLKYAYPTKITGTGLKSQNSEVAVESLELAFESFEIA